MNGCRGQYRGANPSSRCNVRTVASIRIMRRTFAGEIIVNCFSFSLEIRSTEL